MPVAYPLENHYRYCMIFFGRKSEYICIYLGVGYAHCYFYFLLLKGIVCFNLSFLLQICIRPSFDTTIVIIAITQHRILQRRFIPSLTRTGSQNRINWVKRAGRYHITMGSRFMDCWTIWIKCIKYPNISILYTEETNKNRTLK